MNYTGPKITTWEEFAKLLSPSMAKDLIDHAILGDPEWLSDMLDELNYLKPDTKWWVPEFHGVILSKVSVDSLDANAIFNDFYALFPYNPDHEDTGDYLISLKK